MESNFVIWIHEPIKHDVTLKDLQGFEQDYKLVQGVHINAEFPKDTSFQMDPDLPHDTILTDDLRNIDDVIVVSKRVKEFLQAKAVTHVEYLTVLVLDHKGKKVGEPYFIVHPVDPIDCIDRDRSDFEMSEIADDWIDDVYELVLDESRIPEDRLMFRLKYFYDVVIVRRDLAEKIDKQGFAGIGWEEIDEFES